MEILVLVLEGYNSDGTPIVRDESGNYAQPATVDSGGVTQATTGPLTSLDINDQGETVERTLSLREQYDIGETVRLGSETYDLDTDNSSGKEWVITTTPTTQYSPDVPLDARWGWGVHWPPTEEDQPGLFRVYSDNVAGPYALGTPGLTNTEITWDDWQMVHTVWDKETGRIKSIETYECWGSHFAEGTPHGVPEATLANWQSGNWRGQFPQITQITSGLITDPNAFIVDRIFPFTWPGSHGEHDTGNSGNAQIPESIVGIEYANATWFKKESKDYNYDLIDAAEEENANGGNVEVPSDPVVTERTFYHAPDEHYDSGDWVYGGDVNARDPLQFWGRSSQRIAIGTTQHLS